MRALRRRGNRTRVHAPSGPTPAQHAMTWACGTARKLGISWTVEKDVQIDASTVYAEAWIAKLPDGREVVCSDAPDFVALVREERDERRRGAA